MSSCSLKSSNSIPFSQTVNHCDEGKLNTAKLMSADSSDERMKPLSVSIVDKDSATISIVRQGFFRMLIFEKVLPMQSPRVNRIYLIYHEYGSDARIEAGKRISVVRIHHVGV